MIKLCEYFSCEKSFMGKVSIVRTKIKIKQDLILALDLIGGLNSVFNPDDRIILKPNLNGAEGCTNKDLTESLIQLLFDFGAKKVAIAEASFGNAKMTDRFFHETGYTELAKRYRIPLININRSEAIEIKVKNPLIMDKLRIGKEVFEFDKIINLPVMKVHYATGVTLALKNLKGLLVCDEKKRFHEMGLDKSIVDLNNTIKPALNIIDATSGMEEMGPRGGKIVHPNLLITGVCAAETDYTGCRIMDYFLDEVKHLKTYIETNNINVNDIQVVGESVEDARYPFKKVRLDHIIPDKFRIHNKNACSSCMNAFLLSCRLLETPPSRIMDVFMGSIVEEEDTGEGIKAAFGNCCTVAHKFDIQIKGCPPYPFDLRDSLDKNI